MEVLADSARQIDNINILPDVRDRASERDASLLAVMADLSDDTNREVEGTSVVVAPEPACRARLFYPEYAHGAVSMARADSRRRHC